MALQIHPLPLSFELDGVRYEFPVAKYNISNESRDIDWVSLTGRGPPPIRDRISQEIELEIFPYDVGKKPYFKLNPGHLFSFVGRDWITISVEVNYISRDDFLCLSVTAKAMESYQKYKDDFNSGITKKADTYLSSGIDVLPDNPNMIGGGLNTYLEKQKYEEKKEKLNEVLKNFDFSKRKDKKGES